MVPEGNVSVGEAPACEICVECVRNVYATRMEYLRHGRRRCMQHVHGRPRGNAYGVCMEYACTMLLCSFEASPEEMKAMKQRGSTYHSMAQISNSCSHGYVRQSCGNGGVSDSHKPAVTIKCLS